MKIQMKMTGAGRIRRVFTERRHAADSVMYSVEYTADHAIPVHENLDAYHAPPTQAKFLEQPFRELRPDMTEFIADAMNRGQTMRQGAFRAVQKLLAVSRRLAPIETGELRRLSRINREK